MDTCNNQEILNLHSNPDVGKAISTFEKGELLNTVNTCLVCKETRPVFHATTPQSTNNSHSKPVSINPWKLTKEGLCQRCHKDILARAKKANKKPSKFSGCFSDNIDMGPPTNLIRTNNMHFEPVPPYLENLTTVEMALVSRITVVMRVHILRYGMLASKGHSISKLLKMLSLAFVLASPVVVLIYNRMVISFILVPIMTR